MSVFDIVALQVYKEPLEKAAASGNAIMAVEDIRTIFGGIKEIAALHSHLHHDVSEIIDNWEEDCCIADVIKKYKSQLIEVCTANVTNLLSLRPVVQTVKFLSF